MRKKIFGILIILFATNVKSQDSTYIWPTNSGQFLSSTFGETRSAHFHAGLDIKTWGREGYEVYATKDGILSRLLITNKGYGKAIYLKHEDGYYTVYAHLQRFNENFQAIADSIRLRDFSYTFQEFLEPQNIQVKKGDIIGYTGSTGIGPPHLHYEIRNEKNQPINPLQSNLSIEDTIAPTFSSILIEPLSIYSRIFDSVYPQKIDPVIIRNDTTFFDTVYVKGSIGLSPNVFDESNSVTNKYSVYSINLVFNEDTLYSEKLDRFDFAEADNMFLNRVPEPGSNRRSYQRLFTTNDGLHPFLIKEHPFDTLRTGTYSIIAEDYFGNESTAIIPISNRVQNKTAARTDSPFELWTNNWISVNDSTNIDLVDIKSGIIWDLSTNQRILNYETKPNRTISRIAPELNQKIISPDFNMSIHIPSGTFFDSVSIVQEFTQIEDSIYIQVGVPEIPLRKDIFLQIYLNQVFANNSKLNLYHINNEGDTSYVDSWKKGATLNASINSLGNFIVLEDSTAPEILTPKIVTLGDRRLTYSIKTKDNLSGIDFESAVFEINGIRGIPEYDYEDNTFTYYHPSFEIKKENAVFFKVKDRAGNLITKSFLLKN